MFYTPFWIYLIVMLILATISVLLRKIRFIDIQVMIMVIAVAMSLDMIFCKQAGLYYYVDTQYRGWYSFWANFVIVPSIGLVFIKFVPSKRGRVALYIIMWSIIYTLFELYILKPFGIVHYPKWKILPWSTIGYVLVLTLEYAYFKLTKKHQ